MKTAILNIADTGALESTATMLQAVGYECVRPDHHLLTELRRLNLENVLSVDDLVRDWGYAYPCVPVMTAALQPDDCDLFVDTKAHVNYPKIVAHWPHLQGRVLWCCLNGGDPRARTDGQPWANPPCPVLTNNQWYRDQKVETTTEANQELRTFEPTPWAGRAYACFPPYAYMDTHPRLKNNLTAPVCLVHRVRAWGYGQLVDKLHREYGVRFYGVDCPDGLLKHADARLMLQSASCLLHLKIGDTVGYATVEAAASQCPIVCSTKYARETLLGNTMLENNEGCFHFRDGDDEQMMNDIRSILNTLEDRFINRVMGLKLRRKYERLMWADVNSFGHFMERNFP